MTTDRLKKAIVEYLRENKPSDDFLVYDAQGRETFSLPSLAVNIPSVERYSLALPGVQRAQVEVVLRCHAGDGDEMDLWQDQIESLLNDPSAIRMLLDEGIRLDLWDYAGGSVSWEESVVETRFTAEAIVSRV
jgi:hypothetical protein